MFGPILNARNNSVKVTVITFWFVCVLCSCHAAIAQSTDDGWTLYRGDSASSGVAKTNLPAEPEVIWKHKVANGSFESTPVIIPLADRSPMVVVGDLDGRLLALDLSSGDLIWEKDLGELGFTAAAACRDGKIFIGDFDGFFHCLDLEGKLVWKYEAEGEINGSANFYKELVLFGAQDGCLYALDRESGKLKWKYEADDQIQCSTTVVENRAFLAGCDAKLHVVDLDTGQKVAKVEIESPTGTTPATLKKHVYFGTQQGTFLAVDWKEAKIAWKREDPLGGTTIVVSAAVNDQQVVYAMGNRQVISLEPETGKERWVAKLRSKAEASPVIVGDRILLAATDGRLFLLDHDSGETAWQRQLNGSIIGSPAVAFERLVVATDRGLVYCLGKPQQNKE
jgi:outer membrane protein assembly factor BamB